MGQLHATKLSLNVCVCSLQTAIFQGESAKWDAGPGKMNVVQKTPLYVFMCYSQLFLSKVKSLISHQRDSGQPCEHRCSAWLESWGGPLVYEIIYHSDPFERHRDGWDLLFFSFCMERPLVWVRQTATEGCRQSHWSCFHHQVPAALFPQQLHLYTVGWKGMLLASQLYKQIY